MGGKLAILCAGDTELAPFLPLLHGQTESRRAMLTFYEGWLEGLPVVTLYSGVCRVNAAIAAQLLIDHYGVQGILSAGTAGGVDPALKVFDTVVSTQVAYHDLEPDCLTDFHPWLPSIYFEADGQLLQTARVAAQQVGGTVRFGRMVTGECFVQDELREQILAHFSPLSADMESAAIAHVCYVNRLPFLSVRTITDTAEHTGMENFERHCEEASGICARLVAAMARVLAENGWPNASDKRE